MSISSVTRQCDVCRYMYVDYEIPTNAEESILYCASCFMKRCFANIKHGNYPAGATMEEFRQQIMDALTTHNRLNTFDVVN